jgi:chromosome segregation ATPase
VGNQDRLFSRQSRQPELDEIRYRYNKQTVAYKALEDQLASEIRERIKLEQQLESRSAEIAAVRSDLFQNADLIDELRNRVKLEALKAAELEEQLLQKSEALELGSSLQPKASDSTSNTRCCEENTILPSSDPNCHLNPLTFELQQKINSLLDTLDDGMDSKPKTISSVVSVLKDVSLFIKDGINTSNNASSSATSLDMSSVDLLQQQVKELQTELKECYEVIDYFEKNGASGELDTIEGKDAEEQISVKTLQSQVASLKDDIMAHEIKSLATESELCESKATIEKLQDALQNTLNENQAVCQLVKEVLHSVVQQLTL